MPLMVRLGANEKMVINGAVVSVEGGRAAKIVDMMEAQGVVGAAQGPMGKREIYISAA